jgi:iron only hydrogenase large subunit-like protein
MDDEYVDYVLSVEEVGAFFVAKQIEAAKAQVLPGKQTPTATGRNFAKSGGVAAAVRARLKDPSMLRETVIDGLDREGMKKLAAFGKMQSSENPPAPDAPNLVEVMTCQGGCIAGPSVITNPKVALTLLDKYAGKV